MDELEREWVDSLWMEAAGPIGGEIAEDTLREARALIVAHMGDQTFDGRLSKVPVGCPLRIDFVNGSTLQGTVAHVLRDAVVMSSPSSWVVVPFHAIDSVHGVPIGIPNGSGDPAESWRSCVRRYLGLAVRVETVRTRPGEVGVLAWVGRDHVTIMCESGSVTVPWNSTVLINLPLGYDS